MLTRLLVLLVVLVVLAVGADRLGAVLAARSVAEGLTSSQRLTGPATVSFPDIPFLTQAVAGRYDRVDVTLQGVPVTNGLVVDRIDTTLHGVTAPAGPMLRGQLTQLPVERGEAVAFVSFTSLADAARRTIGAGALGVQLTSLDLGRAAADRVAVGTAIRTPLGTFALRGQAQLTVKGGVVGVRLLPESLTGVPAALRSRVAALLDLTALAPPLPFGFRATSVAVEGAGLRLRATGTRLSLPA